MRVNQRRTDIHELMLTKRILPLLGDAQGTSGSGKSTLGASIAEALCLPFVDGDDLHPTSNVDKMANGVALNDEDRLPWLLAIRQKAIYLCANEEEETSEEDGGSDHIRRLAERWETSEQPVHREGIVDAAERIKGHFEGDVQAAEEALTEQRSKDAVEHTSDRQRACVVACSALKKSYRDLLRYGLSDNESGPTNKLDVYHVYVRTTEQELLRRMHERKGHFMKENMLRSQLATLEEPFGEERVLLLDDAPIKRLTEESKLYFDNIF